MLCGLCYVLFWYVLSRGCNYGCVELCPGVLCYIVLSCAGLYCAVLYPVASVVACIGCVVSC